MTKWEYNRLMVSLEAEGWLITHYVDGKPYQLAYTDEKLHELLVDFGKEEWELVSVISHLAAVSVEPMGQPPVAIHAHTYVFKRPFVAGK